MTDQLDDLKGLWRNDRLTDAALIPAVDKIIKRAEEKRRKIVATQTLNIVILLSTLVGIGAFFAYVAKFNGWLSQLGSTMMMGSLAVRILIEVYSLFISRSVDLTKSSKMTNDAFFRLYKFRLWVHGPTTIVILVLYTMGFYMLTPEFSLYFSLPMLILIDSSYIVGAVIVGFSIRHGIKKEMADLNQVKMLRSGLNQS
jgi:hypothetical protein